MITSSSASVVMIKAICLLSMVGTNTAFTLPSATQHYRSSMTATRNNQQQLRMGYLDNLSPEQPEGEKKKSNIPKKKHTGGGLVPSGRGPEGSYLDAMTGGGDSTNNPAASAQPEDPVPTPPEQTQQQRKAASWSNEYLTDFLTGQDDARTDIRNLLTQRSIQSFIFLLDQCRDPHSAKWIQEDFLDTGNLMEFHGTGAGFIERFGGTWDAALLAMVGTPASTMIISAKRRGRGHGGWSKNNPYLKERWMEMPITIDPPNLVSRLLAVREQIATEWVSDVDVLVEANAQILDSYFGTVRAGGGEASFERTAVNLMNDNSRFSATASSPYRRSNFDLLYNLCTQAAIHRLLRQKKDAGQDRDVPFVFLRNFYTQRATDYFDGDLAYGRADDFMEDLLQTAPSVLTTEDGKTGLVDPVGAAEDIIKMRKEVAIDWKEAMKCVPEDHNTEIRRALLSKQVMQSSTTNMNDDDSSASAGSFQ